MAKDLTIEDVLKFKGFTLGSMITNTTDEGQNYRTIKLNPEIGITFKGKEIDVLRKDKKGNTIVNLWKKRDKHENLIKAEEQYGFEVTHDVSVKFDKGE